MLRAYVKSVVWNTAGYQRPSGQSFTSGWAKDHGYGSEEWNHSHKALLIQPDKSIRYLYTYPQVPQEALNGKAVPLFLIASSGGTQCLVSIAAKARFVPEEERGRIADALDFDRWAEDAWALPSVQAAHKNRKHFDDIWRSNRWGPVWSCDEQWFVPFAEPVPLDARAITGKPKFATMFRITHQLSEDETGRIIDIISRTAGRSSKLNRVLSYLKESLNEREGSGPNERDVEGEAARDIEDICNDESLSPTTKTALIQARLGQGNFRKNVLSAWGGACAVTGVKVPEAIRASHIKPWYASNNAERLEQSNGLPLVATLDALFDRGLISFTAEGKLKVSSRLSKEDAKLLVLGKRLRRAPTKRQATLLKWHLENEFKP